VPCSLQIVENGSPKSEGGVDEPSVSQRGTSMLRPREIQVGAGRIRRDAGSASHPGIRSGAEASSPTGDRGCLRDTEWRNPKAFHWR